MLGDTQYHVSRNAAFLVILGVMLAMLGVISAMSPFVAGLTVELAVGVMVLCRGSMQLYYGFKVRHWGHGFGSYMGLGSILMSLLSVAAGVLLLVQPLAGLSYLSLLLAAYLVINGGFDVLHALELRTVKGWPVLLLNGLASVALGSSIWQQWPYGGRWAIGIMIGASLILSGLTLIALGLINYEPREPFNPNNNPDNNSDNDSDSNSDEEIRQPA